MANIETAKINAVVLQHLSKVAPDIAQIFRRTHPCDQSEIFTSLPQIVSHYKSAKLANGLVYKYANHNYPQLSRHFKREFVACELTLEDVVDCYNNDHTTTSDTLEDVVDCYNNDHTTTSDTLEDVVDMDCYNNDHKTSGKRKRDNSGSRRVKRKKDTQEVLPKKDCIDSEFLRELEKYYPCIYSSESSSDSEIQNTAAKVMRQTQLKGSKTTQVSTKKSLQNFQLEDIVGFCPILDCDIYKNLQINPSEHYTPLDILTSFILKENILVRKLHQLVKTGSPKYIRAALSRTEVGKDIRIKGRVKIGHFSPGEDALIESNWKKLVTKCGLGDQSQVFKDISDSYSKKSNEEALKQNVVGLYLSLGMSKVRHASDVFQHAKIIFTSKRKKHQTLTAQEQLLMTEYVEKHGENCDWKELGFILFNHYEKYPCEIKQWYKSLKNKGKGGLFTLLEDKLIIDAIIFDNKANLSDPNSMESVVSFETLEKQLGRQNVLIRNRWYTTLKPCLLQYHAGTLNLDIKRILFNYLNENKVIYLQDIEWSELFQQSVFAGETKRSLTVHFYTTKAQVSRAKKCLPSEVTVPMITEYVNERQPPKHQTLFNGKRGERKKEVINYYKMVINEIKDSQ